MTDAERRYRAPSDWIGLGFGLVDMAAFAVIAAVAPVNATFRTVALLLALAGLASAFASWRRSFSLGSQGMLIRRAFGTERVAFGQIARIDSGRKRLAVVTNDGIRHEIGLYSASSKAGRTHLQLLEASVRHAI